MKAKLLQKIKQAHASGTVEIAIWQVPEPVPPCTHGFKYRVVYIVDGVRVVGYDNERGKGDHSHNDNIESPYQFIGIAALLRDFWRDVNNKTG